MVPDANVRAILLDIEGTTTPVEFVYQVLFPFARQHVREFIEQHFESDDVRAIISALSLEHRADVGDGHGPPVWRSESAESQLEAVVRYVDWLMDQDRKSTALKSLQGKIWEAGYLSGQLHGEVYPDVSPALARWTKQQKRIYIYSSGSVLAQKLLFAHTTDGDVTRYISGYFDTTTGAKTSVASYQAIYQSISEQIDLHAGEVLFLSDVIAELDAALQAGMKAALCLRSVSHEPKSGPHKTVGTFDVVFP